DVHERAALDVRAQPDVAGVVERVAEGGADEPHRPDRALVDQLAQAPRLRRVAVHERFRDEQPGLLGRVEHGLRLLRVGGQRLLAEHVLAGLERPDRPLAVERVRQRDVDRLDVRILEQRLVRAVGALDPPLARECLRPPPLAARDRDQVDLRRRLRSRNELPFMSAVETMPQAVMHVVSRAVAAKIGVGMLGYAFMGKAHSNAFRKLAYMTWPPPLLPSLRTIAGRNEDAVREAAERYGYERWTTDWRELVADPEVGLFDNGGPNSLHAEPTIAAARAGKHGVCEKPLGRDADESHRIWREVAATGVKHMCAFNYRFVPAVR